MDNYKGRKIGDEKGIGHGVKWLMEILTKVLMKDGKGSMIESTTDRVAKNVKPTGTSRDDEMVL